MDMDIEQSAGALWPQAGHQFPLPEPDMSAQRQDEELDGEAVSVVQPAATEEHLLAETDTPAEDTDLTPERLQQKYEQLVSAVPVAARSAVVPNASVVADGPNTQAALFLHHGGKELHQALVSKDTDQRRDAEDFISATLLLEEYTNRQHIQFEVNTFLNSGNTFIHDADLLLPLMKAADMMTARAMSLIRLRSSLRNPAPLSVSLRGENQQVNIAPITPPETQR